MVLKDNSGFNPYNNPQQWYGGPNPNLNPQVPGQPGQAGMPLQGPPIANQPIKNQSNGMQAMSGPMNMDPTFNNQSQPGQEQKLTDNAIVPFNEDSMFGNAPYANTQLVKNEMSSSQVDQGSETKLSSIVSEQSDLLKDVATSLKSLTTQLTKMEERMQSDKTNDASLLISNLTKANSDMKAELHAIKTLLLANHIQQKLSRDQKSPDDITGMTEALEAAEQQLKLYEQKKEAPSQIESDKATPPDPMDELIRASKEQQANNSNPEGAESSEEKTNDEIKREKIQACSENLANLKKACTSIERLEPAANTLLLYLSNLISNWEAIPYGRISTNNPTYTKCLKEIPFHLEFLKACGFEDKANSSRPTLEFSDEWRKAKDDWAEDVLKEVKQSLITLQEEIKDELSNAKTSTKAMQSTESDENKIQNVEGKEETPTATSESYPSSFFEVSNMLAKDKNWRPPNIKTIPNVLSEDANKYQNSAASMAVPKPWEKGSDTGAPENNSKEKESFHPSSINENPYEKPSNTNATATSFDEFLKHAAPPGKAEEMGSSPVIEEIPENSNGE